MFLWSLCPRADVPLVAVAVAEHERPKLTSAALRDALSLHVLPRLGCVDLASFSCTCVALRHLAYGEEATWISSAAAVLPPQHPTVADRAAVQSACTRRWQAKRNIGAGVISARLDLTSLTSYGADTLFSPDGSRLAVSPHTHAQ